MGSVSRLQVRGCEMIVDGRRLGDELVKILGLPQYTAWFRVDFSFGSPVMITCEFYPSLTPDDEGALITELKKYKLVEIKEEDNE